VSKGVQGGNRRRATGRVTPSKLRRSAVIAVDGVLALGTGAIGGLFATGTGAASAAAPPVGWTALQSPTVTGPDAPAANPETEMLSTSCASAVFCAAGGDYLDAASNGRGLLETLAGGTWSAQEAPLPSDAGPDPSATFKDVSCPTAGWCVAVGGYLDGSGHTQSTFDVLSGGHWTAKEAPAPSDLGNQVQMYSVSCPAPGSCTAVGNYVNTGGKEPGLIDTLSNGQWTAQIAPAPNDAMTNQIGELDTVSCPTTNFCGVGGFYRNSHNGNQLEVLQESNGTWAALDAPLPNDAATLANARGNADSISCVADMTCEMVGQYADTSGNNVGLLEHLAGGVWSGSAAPEPAGAGSDGTGTQDAALRHVSCTFDEGCVAVGFYEDMNHATHALIDSVTNGVATAVPAPVPSDVAPENNADELLFSVSCVNAGQCSAVGEYRSASQPSNTTAMIDQESGGIWTSIAAPLPGNAATGSSAFSTLSAVSCVSRGACNTAGSYDDPGTFGFHDAYTPPEGYWSVASDGGIFNYGDALFHGSMGGQHLNAPMVGMAATPGNGGYWEVGSDGGIFSFGNATFHGSTGSLRLNAPIVGMAATPDGGGYWLVATDGGIFNYGDAGFYGSAGSIRLNKPIVGMAPTPDGHGYWLVASDGGIFTYGDAVFYGSRGGQPLNRPVVGMAADATGLGYWLVASDGGIFSYGDAVFHGSAGSIALNKPIVAMMSTFDGNGYWLTASDGGIFSYGDTGFYGSAGSLVLNAPVVSGTPT